jgi:hypothetical protein
VRVCVRVCVCACVCVCVCVCTCVCVREWWWRVQRGNTRNRALKSASAVRCCYAQAFVTFRHPPLAPSFDELDISVALATTLILATALGSSTDEPKLVKQERFHPCDTVVLQQRAEMVLGEIRINRCHVCRGDGLTQQHLIVSPMSASIVRHARHGANARGNRTRRKLAWGSANACNQQQQIHCKWRR